MADSPEPALVTISRTHKDDVQHRQVIARIDDGEPLTLLFGDSRTETVVPGEHRLRAHNTLFYRTRRFTVAPGERVRFELVNASGRLTLGFLATMGVAPLYLRIEQVPATESAPPSR